MLKIGKTNKLKVNRMVDFGAYLDGGEDTEILLPAKYFTPGLTVGDEIEVFVYKDSEDRLIATTEMPIAQVGEFAFMEVNQVNKVGAFLRWGITAKDLLVPFREQKADMREGGVYLVYVYLDDATKRIVGSQKIEKFLGNVMPRYVKGDQVDILVTDITPIGYRCIVDNLHYGMIYSNEVYQDIEIGKHYTAYVKNVRPDLKIDLMMGDRADRRTADLGTIILNAIKEAGGQLPYSDKTDPETIQQVFSCSKKDFKKAIGHLFKDKKIVITSQGIYIL